MRAAVPAFCAADAFINELFDDSPAAVFGSSAKGLALVLDTLITGADPEVKPNPFAH